MIQIRPISILIRKEEISKVNSMKRIYSFLLGVPIIMALISCSFSTQVKPTATFQTTVTLMPSHRPTITSTIKKEVQIQDFIGLIVPPYPDELIWGGGLVLDLSNDQWSFSFLRFKNNHYLSFDKFLYRDSEGKAFSKIMDFLQIPVLSKDEVVIPSGCMLNKVIDDEIIVIALLDPESYFIRFVANQNIRRAWRAEKDIGKFIEIETTGISCYADDAISYSLFTPMPGSTP